MNSCTYGQYHKHSAVALVRNYILFVILSTGRSTISEFSKQWISNRDSSAMYGAAKRIFGTQATTPTEDLSNW